MALAEPDPLGALINLAYDAALDQRLWQGFADKVAHAFGSTSTVVKTHGTDDQVQLLEATKNLITAPKDHAWADHWHKHDLWVERSIAFGMSRVITDGDLLSPAEFEKSGFYQDWNRHLGIYHMVGAVFQVDQDTVGVLGIHRPKQAGVYTNADRKRVEDFLPHLHRALRIRNRLSEVSLVPRASLDALDRLDTGVIIVDARCFVLHANRLGETILIRGSPIGIHCGRLAFNDRRLEAELMRRVQAAARTAAGVPETPPPALLIHREGRLPMSMLVTPLSRTWDQAGGRAGAALVFIKDPEEGAPAQQSLRELFGLTRTEAAIAAALADGCHIPQIASSYRISPGTVRSHIKTILAKTGTHRQAQLVALIARTVASIEPAATGAGVTVRG